MQDFDFSKIVYRPRPINKSPKPRDVTAIGFDSEADRDGKTFMYCLSDGSVYTPDTLLSGLFTREHRGGNYVVYNLKYEQGAILQILPIEVLETIRRLGNGIWNGYRFKTVGYKSLRISKGKNAVTFWDMYTFFNMSLAQAGRQFTKLQKHDMDVTLFTDDYIRQNWKQIRDYCIRDAKITAELFRVLLSMCNKLGIKPTVFYSIASIGYKYIRENTNYVTVEKLWNEHREVLEAACNAYTGGKFEVTTKGSGNYYEYDINSAYPYEYANLIDISDAYVVKSKHRPSHAVYGFLKCKLWIDKPISHSLAVKRKTVNIYPIGKFTRWLTAEEFDYLKTLQGVTIDIITAYWLTVKTKRYPYKELVYNLFKVKQEAKRKQDKELYHLSKYMLNSVYGKLVQLVKKDGKIEATTCWNPIYGAIITANVRLRIARLQNEYHTIFAVHTDSVLSTEKLPLVCSEELGDWNLSCYGLGVILGSGIYQIGDKVRFRGFPTDIDLIDCLARAPPVFTVEDVRAITWKEVVFHHWDTDLVNRFRDTEKSVNINFDTKRLWDSQWEDGQDALDRQIDSIPFILM